MSDEAKKFRSSDRLEIRNARVMWVGEPRTVGEKTLCSAKVVSQPGNERDMDCWVTFTGAEGLGQKIFNLKKGDRVNVAGKPFFGAYVNDSGAHPTVEIKFPEYVEVVFRAPSDESSEDSESEDEPEPAPVKTEEKRKPGRPRKNLPFDKE